MDDADIKRFEDELYKNFTAEDIDPDDCYKLAEGIFVVSSIPGVPVEYSGVVDDMCFYFKSRGETWQFSIAKSRDECLFIEPLASDSNVQFVCMGRYSEEPFSAGYMPIQQAEELICQCVQTWRNGVKSK